MAEECDEETKLKIEFKLINENGDIKIDDYLKFSDGEYLYTVLNRNYVLECKESVGVGKAVLGVNEYKTNFIDNYFKLIIDGIYSNYGVEKIKCVDGMVVELIWTKIN